MSATAATTPWRTYVVRRARRGRRTVAVTTLAAVTAAAAVALSASAAFALPPDGCESCDLGGGVYDWDPNPGDDDGEFGEGDHIPPSDDDGEIGEGDHGPLGGGGVFDGDPVPRRR
jgi:hypothetical protein